MTFRTFFPVLPSFSEGLPLAATQVTLNPMFGTTASLAESPHSLLPTIEGMGNIGGNVIPGGARWERSHHGTPEQYLAGSLIIPTSLTVQYAEGWGVERIALDGVQNHLPSDSKGRHVFVDFLVDGTWIPLAQRSSINGSPVQAISFRDDGIGFTYEKLELLFSGKRGDQSAVGQFGEGLKMITAACLREGMPLEIYSRNWKAVPFVRARHLDGAEAHQVCYNVSLSDTPRSGSMTVIQNPSPELVRCVMELEAKVLPLRRNYRPLFHDSAGEIVDESGDLFVKGVHITDSYKGRLLFGYNLATELNRDRNVVDPNALNNAIGTILRNLSDPFMIKKLLAAAQRTTGGIRKLVEYDAVYWHCEPGGRRVGGNFHILYPDIWKRVFREVYGEQAVLGSPNYWNNGANQDADRLARALGYRVVKLPEGLLEALKECGLPSSSEVTQNEDGRLLNGEEYDPDRVRRDHIESGITLEYRAQKWRELRILLDLLANHMPGDSGSSSLPTIECLVVNPLQQQQLWISLKERKPIDEIQAIRFRDEGKGYDSSVLGVFFSTKQGRGDAVGQFGEGLAMTSTAVLRLQKDHPHLYVKLRSRDWAAMPFAVPARVNDQATEKMFYKRAEGLNPLRGSVTTLYGPTPEMIQIADRLGLYVLAFNPAYRPLFRGKTGTLFDGEGDDRSSRIPKGTLFVKGMRHTDSFSSHLLFSYDLRTTDINPDRDMADPAVIRAHVRDMISHCDREDVIVKILQAGKKDSEKDIYEFQTIVFDSSNEPIRELYKTLFHKVFGPRAVLYTTDPFLFAEAKHNGYEPIGVHPDLHQTLLAAGVLTDREVVSEGFMPSIVEPRQLTSSEREVLASSIAVDRILGLQELGTPIVFNELTLRDGRSKDNIAGFYQPHTNQVFIRRDQLGSLATFVETYIHEKGHQETGARDPEDRFREFFEFLLAGYVMAEARGEPRVATSWQQRVDWANLREKVHRLTIDLQKARETVQSLTDENKTLREQAARQSEGQELEKLLAQMRVPWYQSLWQFFFG